jgi:hypothetical protein
MKPPFQTDWKLTASSGERSGLLHTREVPGSIPGAPIVPWLLAWPPKQLPLARARGQAARLLRPPAEAHRLEPRLRLAEERRVAADDPERA